MTVCSAKLTGRSTSRGPIRRFYAKNPESTFWLMCGMWILGRPSARGTEPGERRPSPWSCPGSKMPKPRFCQRRFRPPSRPPSTRCQRAQNRVFRGARQDAAITSPCNSIWRSEFLAEKRCCETSPRGTFGGLNFSLKNATARIGPRRGAGSALILRFRGQGWWSSAGKERAPPSRVPICS